MADDAAEELMKNITMLPPSTSLQCENRTPSARLVWWSGHGKLFVFFWKGCLEFHALFSGWCARHWQAILVWTPQQRSQLRFVCRTGHNGLPVAAEPPCPALQSELGADRHSLRHNVGPSPCERRANVNRRANKRLFGRARGRQSGTCRYSPDLREQGVSITGTVHPKTLQPYQSVTVFCCGPLSSRDVSAVQRNQMAQSAIKICLRNSTAKSLSRNPDPVTEDNPQSLL